MNLDEAELEHLRAVETDLTAEVERLRAENAELRELVEMQRVSLRNKPGAGE